jgi:hypothetical protein
MKTAIQIVATKIHSATQSRNQKMEPQITQITQINKKFFAKK